MADRISDTQPGREQPRLSWEASFDALSLATKQLGRLPRTTAEAEPRLLMWVTNQRRALKQPAHRRTRLESLPGWSWSPRSDRWEAQAEQLRDFIARQNHTPRVRTTDAAERALAHWHSRQRRALAEGELCGERAIALTYATRNITNPKSSRLPL